MKLRITATALFAVIIAGSIPLAAHAGGAGNYTVTGAPFKWVSKIVYSIDLGPLGKLSNTQAAAMVTKAVQQWSGVSTAKLSLTEGDPLDRDVTGSNLGDF